MRLRGLLSLFSAYAVLAQTAVDSYIATESPIAKAGLLANIGPSGSKSQGAKAGIVIASPSNTNPDYLFTWTRDSSLVFKVILDQFVSGADTTLLGQIQNFVASQKIIQQVSNPSGTVSSGGLGEPHYNIDETAFTGAWGRPQRDGPALRATAMIQYANWLLQNTSVATVTSTLWSTIQLDLDYVSADWNQTTFDLWEEVSSSSFFTTAVQHRALREGAALATALGQPASVASGYTTQAANVLCFLQSYWNPTGGYITANTGGGRSGKDANPALASIHTFDPAAGCDSATFQPCSDRALSNLKVYVDAFRSIYTVNSGIASNAAVATGRYPEDSYMGGNPWYLATAAVAEQLYDALIVWKAQGTLNVTSTSLAFFQQFLPSVTAGTYASTTTTYTTLITAVQTFADGFIGVISQFTPSGGGLAEQYSRSNGVPVSAADLTWSYAAMLSAFAARAGTKPASWGAAGLVVPSVCQTSTGTPTGPGSPTATVAVTFDVVATTVPGENIYITGNTDSLQNWSPDNALLLSSANYPTWSINVNVPASSDIQYKYIRKLNGGLTWEADPNNEFQSPSGGSLTRNDVWNGATSSGGGTSGGTGTVAVTFNVVATTFEGENIYITGSNDALQNWSTDNALILSPANYPTWSITINVPASSDVQYKYIRKVNGAFESWESDPNNDFTSPSGGTLVRNDTWR